MAIIDQKKEIFGSIAALNTLNDGFPKLPKFNSLSSINNSTNSTDFLIDLLNTLIGFEALREYVIDVITYRLDQVEDAIKDGLKLELKELVSCNVNPSVPTWFQNGGSGVEIKVTDIDFFDIMKVNPQSSDGNLIYTDTSTETNSRDFNTYLYYTIQEQTPQGWGNSVFNSDILESTFLESGTNNNNVLKFTTSQNYSTKKLTEFNNDFIDSLTLFGEPGSVNSITLLNSIIEDLFGSISASPTINKSKKQLKQESEIREVLDCIINSEDDVIDDSFFTFDNPTLGKIESDVNARQNGIKVLETCGNTPVQITNEDVIDMQNSFSGVTSKSDELNAVIGALDNMANLQAGFVPNPTDEQTVKINFFNEIIKKLTRVIMSLIISPKFITIFAINHQIIYGQGTSYDGAIDFIKKNRKLVKNITKIIANIILNLLLELALKYLTAKLAQKLADDEIEKSKNYLAVLLSYAGVPPTIINQIRRI